MTDMQAALGLCQLEVLDEILAARRELAERYTRGRWTGSHAARAVRPAGLRERTWQSYCVRVDPAAPVGRTELMRRLLADGVATRRGVMAIHQEASYAGHGPSAAAHRRGGARRDDAAAVPRPDDAEQDYVIDRLAAHARGWRPRVRPDERAPCEPGKLST